MTPERPAAARWSIHAPTALSQGRRSPSVSGWPAFIFAMLAAECRSSPSSNSQPSSEASREPIVDLPLPATPATTTIIELEPPSLVGQPAGLSHRPSTVLMPGVAHRPVPRGKSRWGLPLWHDIVVPSTRAHRSAWRGWHERADRGRRPGDRDAAGAGPEPQRVHRRSRHDRPGSPGPGRSRRGPARPRPAGWRRRRRLPPAEPAVRVGDHRGDRPRRGAGTGARPGRGGGRLPGQAVRPGRAAGEDPGGAAAGSPRWRCAQARPPGGGRAGAEGDRGWARGGADPERVRHPGMPGRRPRPGGQPAGDPGEGLGRPPVWADQGAGRARGRAPPQARRAGPDRSRLRPGLPARRRVMARRIVLAMLALVSALLVTSVAPLGFIATGREQESFRMETFMSAQTLAAVAGKRLAEHETGATLAASLRHARPAEDEIWVYDAAEQMVARVGAEGERLPVPRAAVMAVLRNGGTSVFRLGGELQVTVGAGTLGGGHPAGALVLARSTGELNNHLRMLWVWLIVVAAAGLL